MNKINFITKEMILYKDEDTEQEKERKKELRIKILNMLLFSRTSSTLVQRKNEANEYYSNLGKRTRYRSIVAAHKRLRTLNTLKWDTDPFLFSKFYLKDHNELGYVSNKYVLIEFISILEKLLDTDICVRFKRKNLAPKGYIPAEAAS